MKAIGSIWRRASPMSEEIEQTLPARVLLVEDDETTRHLYSAMLEQAGFVVVEAENLNQAAGLLDDSIDIALLDIMLRGQSGLDILKYIHHNFPSCPVIMISASTG